jgi:hypothetical protein
MSVLSLECSFCGLRETMSALRKSVNSAHQSYLLLCIVTVANSPSPDVAFCPSVRSASITSIPVPLDILVCASAAYRNLVAVISIYFDFILYILEYY